MTILSKILCGFLLLAAIPIFYLGARTLKTHQSYRERYLSFVKQVDNAQTKQHELKLGGKDPGVDLGILQAKSELHRLLAIRGRVWTGAVPSQPNDKGHVNVTIKAPKPHQIPAPQAGKPTSFILYVFEEKNAKDGGRYIGEFRVNRVDVEGNIVTLEPSLELNVARTEENAAFLALLKDSADETKQNTWALYDVMPVDSHEPFAGITDWEGLIPAEVQTEYKRDGSPAQGDDPANMVVEEGGEKKFRRPLRDYAMLFREFDRLYTLFRDQLDGYTRDNALVEKAVADQETNEVAFFDKQIEEAKAELKRATDEKNAADAHAAAVAKELERLNGEVTKYLEQIQKDGKELADLQLKAVDAAEKRVKASTAQAPK
jgi:hypothetical protein